MWLFIIKLTILRSGEGNVLNSGHPQVYLNKNIEIYVTQARLPSTWHKHRLLRSGCHRQRCLETHSGTGAVTV